MMDYFQGLSASYWETVLSLMNEYGLSFLFRKSYVINPNAELELRIVSQQGPAAAEYSRGQLPTAKPKP